MLKVAILDDYQNVSQQFVDLEKLAGKYEIKIFSEPFEDEADVIDKLADFEALLVMRERTPITKNIIENLSKLKFIITSGLRNKSIDLDAAKKRKIIVSGTESNLNPTPELTWALILGLARNIKEEIDNMYQGYWQTTVGVELKGKILGLIGLGKVGSQVAKIGKAFGMQVMAWSENLSLDKCKELDVLPCSKEDLIKNSDFLSIHVQGGERYKDCITIKEFDKIASMGIRNIKIADEMFVLNKNHFLKICDLIIERGYDFNIWAYARVDTVKEYYLEKLKKAGVNWLALGIESGNRKIRVDSVKGRFDEIDVVDIVGKIESSGIEVIGNYMFGMSGDTINTMKETLDLSIELNTSAANFNPTMIFPGSPLFKQAVMNGVSLPPTYSGYSYYSKDSFPNPTENLNRHEILKFRDEAFNKYYDRKDWFEKIEKKFGIESVNIYKKVLKTRIERNVKS